MAEVPASASPAAEAPRRPAKKKPFKLKKLTGDALLAYNEKMKNRGVCYLGRVPPYMKPAALRKLLSGYGTEVLRIYLRPENPAARTRRIANGGNRKRSFSEGWIEFEDKRRALKIANALNNTLVGGSHRSFHAHDLWSIKYLHKFEWDDLTDEQAHEARTKQDKMRAELSQSKKETSFYMKQVGQAKAIEAMAERRSKKAASVATSGETAPAGASAGGGTARKRPRDADQPSEDGAAPAAAGGLKALRRSFKQRRVQDCEGRRASTISSNLLLPGAADS
jgi:ESF2/ABP1 family protein